MFPLILRLHKQIIFNSAYKQCLYKFYVLCVVLHRSSNNSFSYHEDWLAKPLLEWRVNAEIIGTQWSYWDKDHTQIYVVPYYLTVKIGFDLTFVHSPTLHFPHYVGQSGYAPCTSTPTNATYKNCKHSTTRLVLCTVLAVIWTRILTSLLHCNIILNHFVNKILQKYKITVKLSYCSALAFLSRILRDTICKFDQSRGYAITRKHVNGSRKFPLRL